jgi:hypothetical protein
MYASLRPPVGELEVLNWKGVVGREVLEPHVQLKDVICFV